MLKYILNILGQINVIIIDFPVLNMATRNSKGHM